MKSGQSSHLFKEIEARLLQDVKEKLFSHVQQVNDLLDGTSKCAQLPDRHNPALYLSSIL